MNISYNNYGQLPTGEKAKLFTLKNDNGLTATITNYGGIIVSLFVPDRNGNYTDIVLGKPSLEEYVKGHPYFGAIVARVAGRINYGRFSLDGKDYQVATNDMPNHLHGGDCGWDKKIWDAAIDDSGTIPELVLKYTSSDGEEGFPGTVQCAVAYSLDNDNSLNIRYAASTDQKTPFNITNHSYFNLRGQGSGTIMDHTVQIPSDEFALYDMKTTFLGKREKVIEGYNDYRKPTLLADIKKLETGNADLYYYLDGARTKEPRHAATVYEKKCGRKMDVYTTEPGVQFYAGISLSRDKPDTGKNGQVHHRCDGLCLETGDFPDTVNFPDMGGAILEPGKDFASTTRYKFSLLK